MPLCLSVPLLVCQPVILSVFFSFLSQCTVPPIHELLSADWFMQDTLVSSWVYAGYSCHQLGLCRILLSADGFMQNTPVSSWVSVGYSCQQLGFCRILLSGYCRILATPASRWVNAVCSCPRVAADGLMLDTPGSRWIYAG